MTSPAPTLPDSQTSTAESSGLKKKPSKNNEDENEQGVKRSLFPAEEPPKPSKPKRLRALKNTPEPSESGAAEVEKPKEPEVPEVHEKKPKRRAATKSKSQPTKTAPGDIPEESKPDEKDDKTSIKKQPTTESIGPAVQDALNRSGTNELAEACPTKEVEKKDGGKEKVVEKEKEISKKRLREKRDLVAHARKMRFYRSLSSLKLSISFGLSATRILPCTARLATKNHTSVL